MGAWEHLDADSYDRWLERNPYGRPQPRREGLRNSDVTPEMYQAAGRDVTRGFEHDFRAEAETIASDIRDAVRNDDIPHVTKARQVNWPPSVTFAVDIANPSGKVTGYRRDPVTGERIYTTYPAGTFTGGPFVVQPGTLLIGPPGAFSPGRPAKRPKRPIPTKPPAVCPRHAAIMTGGHCRRCR